MSRLESTPRPARLGAALVIALGVLHTGGQSPAEPGGPTAPTAKEALAWFNDLVGEWRGVGQVRRGSTKGAWFETGEFVWDFSADAPAVRYVVQKGKHLTSARVTYDETSGNFAITAKLTGDATREYVGKIEDSVLTAESAPDADGYVHRLVITRLNPKRTLVRYERRLRSQTFATRLGEVGYTRKGTSLAVEGAGQPECIVTGGLGTILVKYEGKSYYVCCTGCKQAFDDDPKGVVEEYRRKLAARKREAKGNRE